MTSGLFTGNLVRGLAVRVLFFLSLALLPLGLIAIMQTRQISEQNQTSAELSLLAVTEQASGAERRVIQEAFGAADALGSIVRLHHNDAEACSDFFREYREVTEAYDMVAFIPVDGQATCSAFGEPFDFSENAHFKSWIEHPVRGANSNVAKTGSRRPVTIVHTPVYEGDTLAGFMVLSIPYATFDAVEEPPLALTPLAMMTFNKKGDILTSERGLDVSMQEVPVDIALSLFTGKQNTVFRANNKRGQERAYAVLPIVPDAAYAMSVWPSNTPVLQTDLPTRLSAPLPILMWAAGLIVAFWALNRLAITHIRKLGRQMRRFALNRTLPRNTLSPSVPTELVEIEAAFIGMAESILRDEAQLEDSLREKNILLKEVHHRVKNNLQLISSIMNMQIRQSKSEDARFVLKRLQERILSLATVHKSLYQNDTLVRVDADVLVREIVTQLLTVGLAPGSNVDVRQDYQPISIDADDAAPLTLLISEAMTNALKYVPQGEKGAEISVALWLEEPEQARLTLSNTIGGIPEEGGTGLGSRLIDAFARQLNGQVIVSDDGVTYTLTLTFHVPSGTKQVYDY